MEELCKGFNNMRMKGRGDHVSYVCICDICGPRSECEVHLHIFDGVTPLWESILCLKAPLQKWHNLGCVYGDYPDCGVQNLKLCP